MISNLSVNLASSISHTINRRRADKAYEAHINQLKSNINDAKYHLNQAMENFNNVTEPKLIDFYIYKMQSEQTRYEQLIAEYKAFEKSEISMDIE